MTEGQEQNKHTTHKLNRMLAQSKARRYIWAYVLAQKPETEMRVVDVNSDLKTWLGKLYTPGTANVHFLKLADLDLIEPAADSRLAGKPYKRREDDLWDSIATILPEHGVHLPFGPIGEQLSLPIRPENMVSPPPESPFEPIQLDLF